MVPGSTLRYGSSFWMVSLSPRPSSRLPIDAEARPLPSDETTPPVTKMNLVCLELERGGVLIDHSSCYARKNDRRWRALPFGGPASCSPCPLSSLLTPSQMSSSTRIAILSISGSEVNGRRSHSDHRRRSPHRGPRGPGAAGGRPSP